MQFLDYLNKWKYLLSFLFILITASAKSQATEVLYEKKVYKTVDDLQLALDIFKTKEAPPSLRPAIVFFHGGGWVFGSPKEFHAACLRYAKRGFVTFSVQYRLSINADGSYPHPDITPVESVMDARSAVRWIRNHARDWLLDPDRLIVAGQSAGGQLALSTALFDSINDPNDNLEISPMPNAIILYSGTTNMMEAWVDMLLGERRKEIWSISPFHQLRSGMPPVLAFHGEDDCIVLPYTIHFFNSRMQELNNSYELHFVPGRKHYLGEGSELYARYFDEEILNQTDTFLKRNGLMP